jgi:hypothetical protein
MDFGNFVSIESNSNLLIKDLLDFKSFFYFLFFIFFIFFIFYFFIFFIFCFKRKLFVDLVQNSKFKEDFFVNCVEVKTVIDEISDSMFPSGKEACRKYFSLKKSNEQLVKEKLEIDSGKEDLEDF